MKRLILTFLLVSAAFISVNAQAEKDIRAAIDHVTVFPDRAQIRHEAKADIPAGTTVLRLAALSPYIDGRSIQVKGFGNFMILTVTHRNNYLRNLEESPDVKNLRSQIESLQMKVEDENAGIAVLKEKEAFLTANRTIASRESALTPDQLKNFMELYTNNMEQVTLAILKKNRAIKDYEKQIAALQKQLAGIIGKQELPSGEILVTVSSEKALSGRLTFSYVVMNAGWYPSYDIRVDDISKPVTIFYKANVHQNSGVDWKDVKLSFSNATPWVSGNVPVLNPWFIDYYVPPPVFITARASGIRRSDAPAVMEMAMADDAMLMKEVEAAPVEVEKQIGATTVTFDIAIPYSVPSDGKIQTVELQRISTPAEYKYLTVPKISPLAYLTGEITDWARQSLIGGEATLYFENTYVGSSYLNVNQTTDTLTVSLGNDNSILVKREKREDFTSRRVLGANKTETYSFLITIRNNKPNAVKISVLDQVPISSQSGINVQVTELSGGRHNQQTGEIKWDLEINPEETKQLILTYSVRYPRDKTVILE
jgi:uncharacterized protein (TIGR02231 family)